MPNVNELERIEEDVEDVDTVSVTEDLIEDSVSHDLLVEFTDSKAPDIRGSNGFREFIEDRTKSVLEKQVGGSHYKHLGIEPNEYNYKNNLKYFEGQVVKYVTRHLFKNGVEDIDKAIHYLELIKEYDYNG